MSIYEAIGTGWVIFTSAIATVEIMYLAYLGLRSVMSKTHVHISNPSKEMLELIGMEAEK